MPDDHEVEPASGPDGDAMLALTGLTDKESAFVLAYLKPGEPTFGHKTKAAEAAGYASPRDSGWKVANRPRVREAIAAFAESQRPTLDACMLAIEHLRQKAEEAGDLSTALRAAELLAKRAGAFVERLMIGMDQADARREYTEEEVAEAQRLARLLTDDDGRPALPAAAAVGPSASAVQSGVLSGPDAPTDSERRR